MTDAYASTPDFWPSLAGALLLAVMAVYGWRHRSVPGAPALVVAMVFGLVLLSGMVLKAAAVTPTARIGWSKFQDIWLVPTTTAGMCFILEYVFPGRWLTRHTLSVLALPPLLALLLGVTDNGRLWWRQVEIGLDGSVVATLATAGALLTAYAVGLGLVISAALLWLFARSPLHRWPVAIMLLGQIGARGFFLLNLAGPPLLSPVDLVVLALLSPTTAYAIALFGFRILDPLPVARQAALEQMREGMVVLDAQWRVASVNAAAAALLRTPEALVPGKTVADLLPALPELQARLAQGPALSMGEAAAGPVDVTLGAGPEARQCALEVSPLHDFRGLPVGYLLILHDETERRRAQAQLLEQQRMLAVLHEREHLAHELHDSTGQVLGFASLKLAATRKLLADRKLAQADDHLARLESIVSEAHADVRESILNLRSTPGGEQPFVAALQHYVDGFRQNYGLQVAVCLGPGVEQGVLPPESQAQLFRILQEALSNVRKHARASSVRVSFERRGCLLRMCIQDNGQGFNPQQAAGVKDSHFGLSTMRERAEQLGGVLSVESAPGKGTSVTVDVPASAGDSKL